MDIINRLKITYKIKYKLYDKKSFTHTIYIDGERVLMRNSNFSNLSYRKQFEIVKIFVEKDRICFLPKILFKMRWKEVTY